MTKKKTYGAGAGTGAGAGVEEGGKEKEKKAIIKTGLMQKCVLRQVLR